MPCPPLFKTRGDPPQIQSSKGIRQKKFPALCAKTGPGICLVPASQVQPSYTRPELRVYAICRPTPACASPEGSNPTAPPWRERSPLWRCGGAGPRPGTLTGDRGEFGLCGAKKNPKTRKKHAKKNNKKYKKKQKNTTFVKIEDCKKKHTICTQRMKTSTGKLWAPIKPCGTLVVSHKSQEA